MPSKAEPHRFDSDHGVYGSPGDVSPWDVRFDPGDRAHLDAIDGGRFRIRLWSEPGLTDAMLVARDRGRITGHPMTLVAKAGRFWFWEVVAGPFEGQAEISFALKSPAGQPVYRVPSGITNAVERIDRWRLPAQAPFQVPSWAQGAVIYQIFPDRFSVGDPEVEPESLDPWGSPPHRRRFQGGDLAGVTKNIDYLEDLGIGALYLNPVFTSPSNHKYDTVDYYQVDPTLGGEAALADLVEAAHHRDLKVILDVSLNHCHPRFFAFADLLKHGVQSRYRDWFVVHDWPLRIRYRPGRAADSRWAPEWIPVWGEETGLPVEEVNDPGPVVDPTYESWWGVPTMPRINLAHPEARDYMIGVATHWVRELGIDGWRMDVARYVDHEFWNHLRRAVRTVDPDIYLVAEVMGDAGIWLQGDRFDATMNYTFRALAVRFLATGEIEGEEMMDEASRLVYQYAWPVTLANHNLLGSHDTARFLHHAGGEMWRLRLATVLQLTFPGSPGVFYGDEVGLSGGDDPDCRQAFPWDSDPKSHPLHQTLKSLTTLRRDHPALVRGDWHPGTGNGGVIAYQRRLGAERLLIAINRDDPPSEVALSGGGGNVVWGDGEVVGGVVTVSGRSAVVVELPPEG